MKYIKEVEGQELVIEDANANHTLIYEREGFKPVKEKPKLEKK